jgi:hypothetical protein
MNVPRKGIRPARRPRRAWSLERAIVVFWAAVVVALSLIVALAFLRGVGQD